MKWWKCVLMSATILMSSMGATGCWNYREVDKLAIVAGVAVDKGERNNFKLTFELVQISGGRESKITSQILSMEGRTMFDAVRNAISITGKRLYWSHAKAIVISREIAEEGIIRVIDWYTRDSETRADVYLLVSQGATAKEILEGQESTEEVKSFALGEMVKNQANLGKAPLTDILRFENDLQTPGVSAVAPAVNLRQSGGKMLPHVMGTAFFRQDKLAGFLNGEETQSLLFLRNEIRGGVISDGGAGDSVACTVSLEIFKSSTALVPVIHEDSLGIRVQSDTTTALDEIDGTEDYIDEPGRKTLEVEAQHEIKTRLEALVKKMQQDYGLDVFGFAARIRGDHPRVWNGIANQWDDIFKGLKVDIQPKVHIRNSAMLSKPLKVGGI